MHIIHKIIILMRIEELKNDFLRKYPKHEDVRLCSLYDGTCLL